MWNVVYYCSIWEYLIKTDFDQTQTHICKAQINFGLTILWGKTYFEPSFVWIENYFKAINILDNKSSLPSFFFGTNFFIKYFLNQQLFLKKRISWTDQLDGPAGRISWTGQFSLLEALASSHIQRLTFQFVHCRSFRVRRRPCFFN